MGESFAEPEGRIIVDRLIQTIHQNRVYLSEIDGAIGDGDHGINMDKGFTMAEKELSDKPCGFSEALKTLGRILVDEIGGSMGPLYGTFFKRMARISKGSERIDAALVAAMLESSYEGIRSLGDAKVGDKTMLDTLDPAISGLKQAIGDGQDFSACMDAMTAAAEAGWKSTEDMIAKIGRASRLGERSRGTVDAGATSCFLLLKTMGTTMKELVL